MALLGKEGRKIPGAYKIGSGTVTFVTAATAYIRPDQSEYGVSVYVHGGLADDTCKYKLNTKYKMGDRVTFTYVKATNPDQGCEWAAYKLSKMKTTNDDVDETMAKFKNYEGNESILSKMTKRLGEINTDYGQSSKMEENRKEDIHIDDDNQYDSDATNHSSTWSTVGNKSYIPKDTSAPVYGAKGSIGWNGISFAYIDLDRPLFGRAFMDQRSIKGYINDDKTSLAKLFPLSTRVTCDLYPQEFKKKCNYFAKNVALDEPVVDHSKSKFQEKIDGRENSGKSGGGIAQAAAASSTLPNSPLKNKIKSSQPIDTHERSFPSSRFSPQDRENFLNALKEKADLLEKSNILKTPVTTMDAQVQTEPTTETVLLEKIFDDPDIFRLICTRLPDVIHRYMHCRSRSFFED